MCQGEPVWAGRAGAPGVSARQAGGSRASLDSQTTRRKTRPRNPGVSRRSRERRHAHFLLSTLSSLRLGPFSAAWKQACEVSSPAAPRAGLEAVDGHRAPALFVFLDTVRFGDRL
ncbi:hypothetical protein ANANG_G00086970 [Anguilla anguilla]|uniref:Uncharacterized protein n=1 Tax=Anguilla anguilla TaxID=7936 RepID=A0A9D3ML43_ANGAN|nr:hypothetical protein ANANG_G00086970 [Anguilla anguilla]